MHAPGANNVCIADQVARYVTFKEECRKLGKQEPKGDEVLLFNKVKVASLPTHVELLQPSTFGIGNDT